MKKILLFLVLVLAAINVTAQDQVIHYKKDSKRTYFRVTTEGTDMYYMTFNTQNGKINPSFTNSNQYFKSGYDKINVPEKVFDMQSDDIDDDYREIVEEKPSNVFIEASVKFGDSKDISARSLSKIKSSSKLKVGSYYKLFEVTRAEDTSLLGGYVICQVVDRRKSNILGSEGRLVLRPISIERLDGSQVRVTPTDIHKRGKNRTNVKFWTSLVSLIPAFIPGTGAVIKQGESIKLRLE